MAHSNCNRNSCQRRQLSQGWKWASAHQSDKALCDHSGRMIIPPIGIRFEHLIAEGTILTISLKVETFSFRASDCEWSKVFREVCATRTDSRAMRLRHVVSCEHDDDRQLARAEETEGMIRRRVKVRRHREPCDLVFLLSGCDENQSTSYDHKSSLTRPRNQRNV